MNKKFCDYCGRRMLGTEFNIPLPGSKRAVAVQDGGPNEAHVIIKVHKCADSVSLDCCFDCIARFIKGIKPTEQEQLAIFDAEVNKHGQAEEEKDVPKGD